MDKRFLTAFSAPETWEIMGFKLRPFSIRHIIVLNATDSPFLDFKRFPEPYETIAFLRICSMPKASYDVKPGFLDSLFAYRLHRNTALHANICRAISSYINEYSSPPKFVCKQKKGEVVKSQVSDLPSCLTTLTVAIAKLGMNEEEALDTPLGRLAWYAFCYSIIEGAEDIKLITTEAEERAEDERQSIFAHEADAERKLLAAMANGKIKKLKVRKASF